MSDVETNISIFIISLFHIELNETMGLEKSPRIENSSQITLKLNLSSDPPPPHA